MGREKSRPKPITWPQHKSQFTSAPRILYWIMFDTRTICICKTCGKGAHKPTAMALRVHNIIVSSILFSGLEMWNGKRRPHIEGPIYLGRFYHFQLNSIEERPNQKGNIFKIART